MPQKNVIFQVVLDKEAVETMIGFCYRSKTAQGFEKLTATDVEDAIENELRYRIEDYPSSTTKSEVLAKCKAKAKELFPEMYERVGKKYQLRVGERWITLLSDDGQTRLRETQITPRIVWHGPAPELIPERAYTETEVRVIMSFLGCEVPRNFFTDGNN